MEANKLDTIRKYLSSEFPDDKVDEEHDSKLSAHKFKIYHSDDELILRVYINFLADNDESEITTLLNSHKISVLLKENKDLGISVGNSGVSTFQRFF